MSKISFQSHCQVGQKLHYVSVIYKLTKADSISLFCKYLPYSHPLLVGTWSEANATIKAMVHCCLPMYMQKAYNPLREDFYVSYCTLQCWFNLLSLDQNR